MTNIADLVARQPKGFSLLQPFYQSDDVFRRDLERVFMRHWLCVGHESMAASKGDYFLANYAEESVIIIRGEDGALRAFANVCRHRGSHICLKSEGRASVLVCPYHAWSYNLDGTLRRARDMPEGFDASKYGLKPVNLAVIEGLVMISFAEKPLGLENAREAITGAYRPYGWASAKVAHRETYQLDANWKLAVENYLECYHCAPAHPEYSRLHALEQPLPKIEALIARMEETEKRLGLNIPPYLSWWPNCEGQEMVRSFRYPLYDDVKSGTEDGSPAAPLMGDFTDYDGGLTSSHFGPASFLVGYADHGVIYRFIPKTPHVSEMEIIWLVRGDAQEGVDYDRDKLTWLWRVTTEADKKITEDNQKGVNSRYYEPGPYAPMEANLQAWIGWYLAELVADRR